MIIKKRKILFIGDSEGNHSKVKKLINKYHDYFYIFLGDFQDRGSQSKENIELIIHLVKKQKALAIFGNHEELFLNFIENPLSLHWYDFLNNGGIQTLISYDKNNSKRITFFGKRLLKLFKLYLNSKEYILKKDILKSNFYKENKKEFQKINYFFKRVKAQIPNNYIEFIKDLPRIVKGTNWIASHAPIKNGLTKKEINSSSFLWNREVNFNQDFHQIFGHNGYKFKKITKNNKLIICADDSHNYNLIAFNWLTKKFVK